jgi:hypothetical protein
MKRRERDLITLFNALWYRDFPVIPGHEELGKRAVWTTHIASIIKQCGDLMGLFTSFESGGRTAAVIQNSKRKAWAKIEWEWIQPKNDSVNEINKLAAAANATDEAEAFVFIGYSRAESHAENLEKITRVWGDIKKPLVVILITFSYYAKRRHFEYLQTHYIKNGRHVKVRRQPALPWHVKGTKWAELSGDAAKENTPMDDGEE